MNAPGGTPPTCPGIPARATTQSAAADAKHQEAVATLFLARVAMDAAKAQLDAYALATDTPDAGAVEAADLLDAARTALAGAR